MNAQLQQQPPLFRKSLYVRAAIGGSIALTLMCIFLFPIDYARPEWGEFWFIRPLIVITFAGACGGSFFHLMDTLSYKGGWRKVLAYIASVIIFVFGLWIGTVLGLVGTLWN